MERTALGRTGIDISPLGFGAFKIGRNEKIKYPTSYDLPTEGQVARLLDGVLSLGINHIDTAPAYGLSEERIGRALWRRRHEIVLSTKVGEVFEAGESRYEFDRVSIRSSITASLKKLRTDVLDMVFIHAPADDVRVLDETPAVDALQRLQAAGDVRAIGLSGKSVAAARQALDWADVLMVEYHLKDTSHAEVIAEAARRGIGVVVKKGLAAGRLPPEKAIPSVIGTPGVHSLVVGGLNLEHLAANAELAAAARLAQTLRAAECSDDED